MTYEEAVQAKAEMDAAIAEYRRDPRFRAMAESTAYMVVDDHGPLDVSEPERLAHRLALDAAIMMLARVYWRDAEVAAMRAERDRYREALEAAVITRPMQPLHFISEQHLAGTKKEPH